MKRVPVILSLLLFVVVGAFAQDEAPPYRDAARPVAERIADLLSRMTVEEKARQLDMYGGNEIAADGRLDPARLDEVIGAAGAGSLHDFYPEDPRLANRVQKYMVENTRLGIPVLVIEEALHGYQGPNATCFPAPVGLGSMWDAPLMQRIGHAIGTEARAHGVHFVLSPVLGLARDPRWGRVEETYGEDPYLVAQTGLAMIRGMQGDDFRNPDSVISEPKHFAIHSIPEGGVNAAPVRLGEREARSTLLYPFEVAVRDGNAHGVMAAYHDWDGVPVVAHPFLLKDLLRDEWGFGGMVLSDLGAVARLRTDHAVADTPQDAIVRAIAAGLDMQFYDFPHEVFQQAIVDAVADGSLTTGQLDRAVASVLGVKFALGLFEDPYVDPDRAGRVLHSDEHRALALEAGRRSICLLKNDGGLLPFSRDVKSVAVVGALADAPALGGYSPKNVQPVTVLDGIRARLGDEIEVRFETSALQSLAGLATIEAEHLRTPDGAQAGLLAEYFNNPDLEGSPDFTQVETSAAPYYHNNSPGGGVGADYFSVRWTGTLAAPISGTYEIGIITDDKGRLYLDDELLVDNWDPFEVNVMMTQRVHLERGRRVPLRMEFAEMVDFAGIRLQWKLVAADAGAMAPERERILAAVRAADLTVLVLGESEQVVGEGRDRSDLDLDPNQLELARAVYSTGKPVAAVLLNGRALSINWLAENAPAIVEAWLPGEAGGTAVAEVLFGDVNPSGKLTVSFPRSVGQLPVFYNHAASARRGYVDGSSEPLFPFGHGLSYTTFEYANLTIEPASIPAGAAATVSFDVKNTGQLAGTEVVQLYVNDRISSVVTPKIELKGFERVELQPGETRRVALELNEEHLALWNLDMERVVEPGAFEIMVGSSSADIRLRGELRVEPAAR